MRHLLNTAPFVCAFALLLVGPSLVGCAEEPRTPASEPPVVDVNANPDKAGDEPIDFNRDIRPILSDRCFACHGPDANVAKDSGGFRLDLFETATAPASSGDIPIEPGDADASEVINRVTHTNPNLKMPPPDSNLTLTASEIELLRRWIDQGAEYQGHWAYQTPVKPALPDITHEDWARNAVDVFIAARMEEAGLSPSQEADRETLIRRLSLDLIGLPPTPEQIDAFVNDASPDAYEKLVDRLLASPHFGERLAIVWLDAARYGDTNGFHHDNIRTAWPWRQWVIEAFNSNMPYDQFVVEQLAGDLLPNATQSQVLASGFCRMHNINDEGGALDEEYIVEAVADRIETVATVFMAQTYTCARCHDHKYDPITQDDYFSTWAYFNSVEGERGVYRNNFAAARAYPPFMMWKSDELRQQIKDNQAALAEAKAEFESKRPEIEREIAATEQALRDKAGVSWADARLVLADSSHEGTTLEIKPDGSVLLGGEVPDHEDITLTLQTDATQLRLLRLDALTDPSLTNNGLGRANNGNAVLSRVKVQAVSVKDPGKTQAVALRWAWADFAQADGDFDVLNALRDDKAGWAVGGQLDDHPRTALFVADQPFGFEGGTELRITLFHRSDYAQHTLGRVRVGVGTANDQALAAFPTAKTDWFQIGPFDGSHPAALDQRYGPEDATVIDPKNPPIKGQRWQHQPAIVDGKNYGFRSGKNVFYFGRSMFTPVERELELTLGKQSALQLYLNGEEVHAHKSKGPEKGNDKLTLKLEPGENTLVAKVVKNGPGNFFFDSTAVGGSPPLLQPFALVDRIDRPEHQTRRITEGWVRNTDLGKRLAKLESEQRRLDAEGVPVLIMKEKAEPNPAYVLERGQYDKPIKDRVRERRPPLFLGVEMPEDAPNNRLGFARWLTQPDHPLTARVHVNRLWQMLFGTGIVETTEDFGSQAAWPSHIYLLDYLAVDFVESGWDQKALIKKIVTSATYRQQAVTPSEALEIDQPNRLLSHFPRRRLPGELIRDQALFAAGLMNDEIGGPSVKPYQPGDLWNEVAIGGTNTGRFQRDTGEKLYRRSLYTFWKKTSPPAQMATFNAPTREFCVVRRDDTNTPLQALVLWNDEQFLEAARALAQRTLEEAQADDARLTRIYRRCTGATPDDRVLSVLREMLGYFKDRYADAPDDAKALLQQGEHPLPDNYDPAELASWMMVASSVLSLDETIVRD
ncbi:MAG: DUF1553 domain-containing protein [Phycisphaeraceae bacterium]